MPADLLLGDAKAMNLSMSYCAMLLCKQITSHALVALVDQVLSVKGVLPVGEIGKVLQDALDNPVSAAVSCDSTVLVVVSARACGSRVSISASLTHRSPVSPLAVAPVHMCVWR